MSDWFAPTKFFSPAADIVPCSTIAIKMEEVILRKLDEMFSDLREEIKAKHIQQVHQSKEQHQHQSHCLSSTSNSNLNINRRHSLPSQVSSGRRVSMPLMSTKLVPTASSSVKRGSLPFNGDGRRSSLPAFPARRASIESQPQRRESTSSSRKFSRDSIDLDLVIEDATEADADSDYNNSIIVEEDEEANFDDEVRVTAVLFPFFFLFVLCFEKIILDIKCKRRWLISAIGGNTM